MGRTAFTEPQCLYKGALYLYLTFCTWQIDHTVALRCYFYPNYYLFCILCYYILHRFLLICSLLCSSNLTSLSVYLCPLLNNWVLVSPRSARGIYTKSSAGLRPFCLLLFCFDLSVYYAYIALYFLSFSHFAHLDTILFLAIAPVRISSLTERLSSKLL